MSQVQPHLEVKIVDPETGATVDAGVPGELCTRGYSVMLGYWEDEAKTREAIDAGGWMHTGDLDHGRGGYFNIVGRIKDMVIRGGENIYPREIEEFLHRMPQVQDVQVVGVPDRKYGEELCLDHRPAGAGAGRGAGARLLQGPDRALQGAALHPLRRCVPDDGHGQDPEIQDPRSHEGRAGPQGRENRMSTFASQLNPRSADFPGQRGRDAGAGGRPQRAGGVACRRRRRGGAQEARRARGKLPPREQVQMLLDPGTPFLEIAPLAAGIYLAKDGTVEAPAAGIIAGIGRVTASTA